MCNIGDTFKMNLGFIQMHGIKSPETEGESILRVFFIWETPAHPSTLLQKTHRPMTMYTIKQKVTLKICLTRPRTLPNAGYNPVKMHIRLEIGAHILSHPRIVFLGKILIMPFFFNSAVALTDPHERGDMIFRYKPLVGRNLWVTCKVLLNA